MEFFDFLFAGVAAFAIKVAPKIIRSTVETIKSELREIFPELSRTYSQAKQTVNTTAEEISEIDREIQEREDSLRRSGSKIDEQKIQDLYNEKNKKYEKYQEAQGQCIRNQYEQNPDKFAKSILERGNENKLLYHTGLITLEKKCPSCARSMRLQHKSVENPTFNDFFWQCTGYYAGTECKTISFRPSDIDLINRTDIEELNVDNQTLSTIASAKSAQISTDRRLKGHLGEKDIDVPCPVHLTAMELREKRGPDDMPLLDKYYLRCAHRGCSQTTKLKSWAQLAAYLNRKEGQGILI
jgi:hypothetical protein